MFLVAVAALAGAGILWARADGCSGPNDGSTSVPDTGIEHVEDEPVLAFDAAFVGEAGTRFRDASPRIDGGGATAEDAPLDPACEGMALDFAAVLSDARCATTEKRAAKLRGEAERDAGRLKHEAKLDAKAGAEADGPIRVVVRLVNDGRSSITLPVKYAPKVASFSALAESTGAKPVIYELEPPKLEGLDDSKTLRVARMGLPPSGAIGATVALSTRILRRIAPACTDDGSCAPAELPRGRYTIYIGQLLCDVETDAPARVDIEVLR